MRITGVTFLPAGELIRKTEKEKFKRYKSLMKKEEISDDELNEIAELELYLDEIPDYLAIGFTTEYKRLKLEFMKREEELYEIKK